MAPRVAVLGGRGWLGRAITQAALRRGLDVVVLSRPPGPGAAPAHLDTLPADGGSIPRSAPPDQAVAPVPAAPMVTVDPTDRSALGRALARCDVVVNAAGCILGTRAASTAANVELPDHLGALAAASGWRLVHVGSAAEYGPGASGPLSVAEDHPAAPASTYGQSKLAGTEAILRWQGRGARALVARVFNIVDADVRPDNPVHGIVAQALAHACAGSERATVEVGDPTTVRDISPRPWVADAVVALATRPEWPQWPAGPAGAAVVNVCSGVPTALGDLAGALGHRLGIRVGVRDLGWPRGGRIVGDPRRLRSLVELAPPPTIDDLAGAALAPAALANPAGEPR